MFILILWHCGSKEKRNLVSSYNILLWTQEVMSSSTVEIIKNQNANGAEAHATI